ncbi:unnamed protein product [Polarella glacialis]|uniref:Uncharacterized protein n=1 Tax=Polarella glacialis TaxID=89957 RepID=A0A813GD30_POLGL|nr:unnamed protein product [Polarella glacialis]CAE8647126.1 unnamed protein product [Polarella glacialis]
MSRIETPSGSRTPDLCSKSRMLCWTVVLTVTDLMHDVRLCASSPNTRSPSEMKQRWHQRASLGMRANLPVSTSSKWLDSRQRYSDLPDFVPEETSSGRGADMDGRSLHNKEYFPFCSMVIMSPSAIDLQRSRKRPVHCFAVSALQSSTAASPPMSGRIPVSRNKDSIS